MGKTVGTPENTKKRYTDMCTAFMQDEKSKISFGRKASIFFNELDIPKNLPEDVSTINPYQDTETRRLIGTFFDKFFNDTKKRVFVLGINPGRFGSGVTGIPFTDPAALQEICGIEHSIPYRRELTSTFVYTFIQKWGGPEKFYDKFFLSAISPFGFTRNALNLNYYDEPELQRMLQPFIVQSLREQIGFGAKNTAIILGKGKNSTAFSQLNQQYFFFDRILPLEHPRFILQYKRNQLDDYLQKYVATFKEALSS